MEKQEIHWIEADANPWGVRVLDIRPYTQTVVSTSNDVQCARNAVSYGGDDGSSFVGATPPRARVIAASLRFPVDRMLAEGVLFIPEQMEHKWAIFYRQGEILCVRSWLREVGVTARVEHHPGHIEITQVRGTFSGDDEDPDLTVRSLDYLLHSHALGMAYPVPLPPGMEERPQLAANWCFSLFGNMALVATPYWFQRQEPDRPLRSHSLLHIATARGNKKEIEASLATGIPIDLLAGDGLPPLHWALACEDPAMLGFLVERGSAVDVRSEEGATPLMSAVQSDELDKFRLLLDLGADINARDHRGFTCLHRAAEMGNQRLVEELLARGADSTPVALGHTARSLAEGQGHTAIVAMLDQA